MLGSLLTAIAVSLGRHDRLRRPDRAAPAAPRLAGPTTGCCCRPRRSAARPSCSLADLAARTLFAPRELPVGVVTALVGGPFFLVLLRRRGVPRA